ncbi:MAG: sugar ABC transporter permease [Chloroflexota bacterium]|nr:sugar ABC transporter permease [Chloroflexota bacterium]
MASTVTDVPETMLPPPLPWYRKLTGDWFPYLLLAPAVITLASLTIYPFIYSIYISLFRYRGGMRMDFIGLGNYTRLLTDAQFWNSMRVVILFTVIAVALEFVLGMALALFLSQSIKLRGLWRSLVIVPMMLTPVVVGVMWRLMLNPGIGIVNFFLVTIGLQPVGWLSTGSWAFVSIVLVDVWNWTPFMFLILLAGLESLPVEPFEAARIDGAKPVRIFLDHTLPLMKPAILVALLIRTMDCLRIFDQIFILTQGGPGNSTEVASLYLYKTAFKFFDQGYAAAGLFVLMVAVNIISIFYVRSLTLQEEV